MKLVNYQLQTQIEYLSPEKSTQFFSEYIRSVLEDDSKSYYQKADYVGLSLQELKEKIDTLSQDIQELQKLKKKLSLSLDMAKEITAAVFLKNGVDRIDGNIISSLTLTKPTTKTQTAITIENPVAVMELGYIKYEPDLEAIEKAMETEDGAKELGEYVTRTSTTVTVPAKIKVNVKRSNTITQADELLSVVEAAA